MRGATIAFLGRLAQLHGALGTLNVYLIVTTGATIRFRFELANKIKFASQMPGNSSDGFLTGSG